MSDPTPAAAAPAKKKPLVLIIAVVVVLLAAGGGAWFFLKAKPAEAAESADSSDSADSSESTKAEKPKSKKKKKDDEKKLSERGLVKMEPFIVNLADEGGKRFLRASIQLVVENAKEAAEFTEKPVLTMGARSAIVDTLTTQTAESIGTPEGKEELRNLLKEKVSDALSMEIVDVLLSDFVVQY
jgi:flagellar FliL protein